MASSSAANYALNFLINRGYSRAAAAGIVGNMAMESSLNPNASGDHGTAYGLGQWRGERLRNLQRYAAATGGDMHSLDTQLGFYDYEGRNGLDAGAKRAFELVQNPNISPSEAANAYMLHYERPNADPHVNGISRRMAVANAVYSGNDVPGVARGRGMVTAARAPDAPTQEQLNAAVNVMDRSPWQWLNPIDTAQAGEMTPATKPFDPDSTARAADQAAAAQRQAQPQSGGLLSTVTNAIKANINDFADNAQKTDQSLGADAGQGQAAIAPALQPAPAAPAPPPKTVGLTDALSNGIGGGQWGSVADNNPLPEVNAGNAMGDNAVLPSAPLADTPVAQPARPFSPTPVVQPQPPHSVTPFPDAYTRANKDAGLNPTVPAAQPNQGGILGDGFHDYLADPKLSMAPNAQMQDQTDDLLAHGVNPHGAFGPVITPMGGDQAALNRFMSTQGGGASFGGSDPGIDNTATGSTNANAAGAGKINMNKVLSAAGLLAAGIAGMNSSPEVKPVALSGFYNKPDWRNPQVAIPTGLLGLRFLQ